MKNLSIIYLLLGSFILGNNIKAQADKATNYLIVLDLSDRLLSSQQATKDLKVISVVYQSFLEDVKKKSIVNSKDRFKIKIVHQPGTSLDESAYQEFLELDLSTIPPMNKTASLSKFNKSIGSALQSLYQQASLGSTSSDYNGVDLWRFFNEQLQLELRGNMHNEVIILNDGYFDYESKTHPAIYKNNRATNTSFYKSIRGNEWSKKMNEGDYGILKTNKTFQNYDVKIGVIGLNPKVNSLTEKDMLKETWKKWLKEIGFKDLFLIEDQNDSNTIVQQLAINLN